MTSKTLKSAIWLTLAAGAVALAAGGVAYGKGKPTDPGGGGKPPTEATNNLSVPAIMAGGMGAFSALPCGDVTFTALVPPTGDPVYYPYSEAETNDGLVTRDAGYFYVQRVHKWQAPCMKVAAGSPVDAMGAWGDNLGGDARLKVGSPIRVELVLWDDAGLADSAQPGGYAVEKLELTELDRVSDYGHRAGGDVGTFFPVAQDLGAIVHDPMARLKIEKLDANGIPVSPAVYDQPAGGEINATGKIIYGYGLRVTEGGTYRLTYSFTNVNITRCEEPAAVCGGTTASLDIVVAAGGGGGRP
jgi:hypothetical protein